MIHTLFEYRIGNRYPQPYTKFEIRNCRVPKQRLDTGILRATVAQTCIYVTYSLGIEICMTYEYS